MSLNLVSEQLLAANGLKHLDLFAILGQLAERRLDYGDLYFQSSYHESWVLSEQLLAANGLKHQDLFAILGQLAERRLDYGDLYFQSRYHESWVLEDRIIKDGSYNIDQGVGVRAISGEKTGFAYADQISLLALERWNRVRKRRAPSSVIVVMAKYRRWAR